MIIKAYGNVVLIHGRIHVRRTDKISEARYYKLSEYMLRLEQYLKNKTINYKNQRPRIYLATDEPTVYREALTNYPWCEWILFKK